MWAQYTTMEDLPSPGSSIRALSPFASIPAFVLVVVLILSPLPSFLSSHLTLPTSPPHLHNAIQVLKNAIQIIKSPFHQFLTLSEAEALDNPPLPSSSSSYSTTTTTPPSPPPVPLWRTLTLSFTSLLLTLIWLSFACYAFLASPSTPLGTHALLISLTWLYATLHPILHPTPTPPYPLFTLYILHLIGGSILLGSVLYDLTVYNIHTDGIALFALVLNLLFIIGLLSIILSMPVGIPSPSINTSEIGRKISPEDYTTLFGWITFSWIFPLIERGTKTTLNENDVWLLSPTMRSRPVFIKFSEVRRSKLLWRLWAANSLDMILDFSLTFVSVVFNYLSPFFLKLILDILLHPTPASRSTAYVYAFLAFLSTLLKAQADVQHLWVGRRAATRIKSELMAAIYDKALKRKDLGGAGKGEKGKEGKGKGGGVVEEDASLKGTPVVGRSDEGSASGTSSPGSGSSAEVGKQIGGRRERRRKRKAEEAQEEGKDEARAGADVGKIVNLMAGDANRIAMMVSGVYFIYGAPFEILIAGIFLYQLLGLSAFAGFLVLVLGWPLNSYISRRSVRIQKGVLAARDKRMGVVNELIGAVKFIKFFAWEERWIDRVMDAREVELQWMVKARLNGVMFYVLWMTAPILVSIISFWAFVMSGNELDVATAFTAIALFNMIRAPLNVIPAWVIQILQTGVALNRIAVFLDEDEVSAQVSSLKKSRLPPSAEELDEDGLGIENGSFKWNEVPEGDDGGEDANKKRSASTDEVGTAVEEPADRNGEGSVADNGDHRFELRDVDVLFPEGELTVITGPTASGKTALLMALLGEMTTLPGSGRIIMSKNTSRIDSNGLMHSISYAAQLPWLRHQSIKENILFGYPFDEERYDQVVECCALKPDLEILEDGDNTEIGARGVSLSGGQKARVALARAVYARTKYVLLDDPLSAVDSHTARFLFERLFCGPLLANRTVILVTHHVELVLPAAYYLVRMLDGRIDTQGTVMDLSAAGVLDDIEYDAATQITSKEPIPVSEALVGTEDSVVAVVPAEEVKKPRKLIKDEHRETGGVKWSVYDTYLKASSYWTWGILAFFIVVSQLLGVGEKLWIKTWGEAYGQNETVYPSVYPYASFATSEHEIVLDGHLASHAFTTKFLHMQMTTSYIGTKWPSAQDHPFFYIGIYAVIGLGSAFINIISYAVQYTGALRASRVLFRRLLATVVRATMRWHDVTPQGRMLNRFGKDIETIDSSLASSLQLVNSSLATFFAAAITVAVFFPPFLFPAFIIGFGYRKLAIGYLNTGRDLRRMESNTRSPIFSGFGELLEGIVTVRAFSVEQRFLDDLHRKIDTTHQMWYTFWMTNRWLLLNFDALGASAVLVTTLFALSGFATAGIAGLCITSAMAFTTSIYWACRFWTALELDLNSVERVIEYLDLPQEPPAIIESSRPPAYWPSSSDNNALIVVEDLVIKYAPELPPVLHGVSFTLKAKERVGLLGRTGSGKSTLAMSILRFVDPVSGRILIDGIDISTIGIHDLRARLTFIPQDATLFSGTLRENLDPFEEHEDSACLDVLYRVRLLTQNQYDSQRTSREPSRPSSVHGVEREDVSSIITSATDTDVKTKINLDTQVAAGGTNFSQGQRQLIAMARALLRRSSVIVLDEATSSIDFATDAKIQATIREEFNDSLLLTVAHRLRTVIDYDRLIVLDKGQVVEFDTPLRLIHKQDGVFRNMCLKSGTFADLEAAAKAKAERDRESSK